MKCKWIHKIRGIEHEAIFVEDKEKQVKLTASHYYGKNRAMISTVTPLSNQSCSKEELKLKSLLTRDATSGGDSYLCGGERK